MNEKFYYFQIAVKEHLTAGVFEHKAIIDLISKNCERVILLFSPEFMKIRDEQFFALFAQSIGVKKNQRKVIPCLCGGIQKEQLPEEFQIYHVLRYDPERSLFNFWDQLANAVTTTHTMIVNRAPIPKITFTEIDAPSPLMSQLSQQVAIDAVSDARTPQPLPRKRKDKSATPKLQKTTKNSSKLPKAAKISSSPTTPNSLKPFWPPSPKLRSQPTVTSSMWTLSVGHPFEKENGRSRSTLSLSDCSPASSLHKKPKWYKKLLSPNSGSAYKLSADSDSSMGMEKGKKKKSWYRKRFRTKNRDLVKEV